MPALNRRQFVQSGLATTASTSLAACATSLPPMSAPALTGDALVQSFSAPLAPIKVSSDRVTRTIVGLRPFRPTGPRLEAERYGRKTIIHNYGHGGGGVSLSWGVAEIAADMAKATGASRIAILGSGAIGLSTALELQRAGVQVSIYAQDFPPYTTSNVAGAMWRPVSLFRTSQVSDHTRATLDKASQIAFARFIHYANDPAYGVTWIRQFSLRDRPSRNSDAYIGGDTLYPGLQRNQTGLGPFQFRHWDAYYTLMIDSDIYLRSLVRDFRAMGGKMRETTFASPEDVMALDEVTVVNCMGLGAGQVFADLEMIPIRGQLSFLLPQNDIDYGYAAGRTDYGLLYSFPRKTGILLGGSYQYNDWDLAPREEEVKRMVDGHAWLASKLA